jgi:hypothetical protein
MTVKGRFHCRLDLAQEGQLWEAARSHLGADALQHAVVDLLLSHGPLKVRSKVEYLSREWLGVENLQLLERALFEAGLALPELDQPPEKVALLSCYSQHIAQGLLLLMPLGKLSRDLRGFRLEHHLGI